VTLPVSETEWSRQDGRGLGAPAANARCVTELPDRNEMPRPDCGASLSREEAPRHECESQAVLDYRLFLERQEEVTLDDELAAYLASPRGRFEAWYAERQRG
jgi:hypothetical protein